MSLASFSDQNELLKQKLSDPLLFSGECFNYLKIVQHALTYHKNGLQNKLLRNPWGLGQRWVRLYYKLRAKRDKRRDSAPMLTSTLFLENGRFVQDASGKTHSAHYHNLRKALEPSIQMALLTRANSPLKTSDYTVQELFDGVSPFPLSENGQRLLNDLSSVAQRLKRSKQFDRDELRYITSAMHVFFEQFIGFDAILKNRGVERCIFDNHYHNEGMIAAIKMNGARAIEIQHGLIAENDLYYCYPEYVSAVRDEALFPDAVLLFGAYWKDVVLQGHEHPAERLHVVGDYTFFGGQALPTHIPKQKAILITAQKNMGESYVPYARQLAKRMKQAHPKWRIWVKLHPLEKNPEQYEGLKEEGVQLKSNDTNLLELLAASSIHISIYSTTFFDAIGLNTLNLSIQDYSNSADYAKGMVASGIALGMSVDDDPIQIWEDTNIEETAFGDRTHYYRTFDPDAFKKAIGLGAIEND